MEERDVSDLGFAGASTSTEVARAQADAVAVAKYEMAAMFEAAMRNPRDETKCIDRLKTACKREGFADAATWEFPRGGQTISGPSVQLARGIAQCWGNIRKGTRILGMDEEMVHIGAFAHDVERGLLETAEAKIKKAVQRKNKQTKETEWVKPDERDLRELINRHGAILERNCVLKIIPADVVDLALDWCTRTLLEKESGKLTKSREDTIRDLALAFSDLGVKREQIEEAIGHSLDTITPDELVRMRGIYKSIKDGNTRTSDHFDLGGGKPGPSGPTSTVKMDLDEAKSTAPKDPAGGSTLTKEPAKSETAPVKLPEYYHHIELVGLAAPAMWLDEAIESPTRLAGMTFRTAAASTDKDVAAVRLAVLDEGARLQADNGQTPPLHRKLAAACWLHDNGVKGA
jgi:hypothetical protein